jgi:hypothetical protein
MSENAVLERLSKLEKSNRRLKVAMAVCGAALVCAMVIGAERATPLVTTEYIRLVDTEGKLRAALGSDKDGTFFFLNDPAGKMRVSMATQKDASYVSLKDPDGKTRATVTFDEAGPAMRLKDGGGMNMAVVSTDQDGAWLEVRDGGGRSRVLSTLSDNVAEPKATAPAAPPAGGAAPAPGGGGLGPRLAPGAPKKYDN